MLRNTFLHLTDIRIHVAEAGKKDLPTIIFLHGFPEFWKGWKNQIPFFEKNGFNVIAPDQRGYNLSDKPPKIKDYKIEQLGQDIIDLINSTGKDKVFLVGHDWGAIVAWHLAITNPELIEKLIILNVPHPEALKKALLRSPRQLFKSWYMFMFQIPWLPEIFAKIGNYWLYRDALSKANNSAISDEALQDYVKAWKQKNAMRSMINWYRAAIRYPFKYKTARVTIPTRIIWGKEDQFLESFLAAKSIEFCDKGEITYLENATHWLVHEEPEKVNQLILEFLHN